MNRRIEKSVKIHSVQHCPVRLVDCALLHDRDTGSYSLELNLQNDSGKVLAEMTLELAGFDSDGREVAAERMLYRVQGLPSGGYSITPYRPLQLPVEKISRFSVGFTRILVYQKGSSGPVENLLR